MKTTSRANKAGSSLVGAVIFLFIGFAVSSIVLMNAVHQNRMVESQVDIERAHFAAEAGLESAAAWIIAQGNGYVPSSVNSPTSTMTNQVNGGQYKYTITKEGFREYSVLAEGTFGDAKRLVSVDRVRQGSFAEYALWTADFQNLWFIPGTVMDGKVHSDTLINLWGSAAFGDDNPTFKEDISTGEDHFGGVGQEFCVFEKDVLFESDQGDLEDINFSDMYLEAFNNPEGIVFTGKTYIDFDYHNGTGLKSMIVSNQTYFGDTDFHRVDLDSKDLVFVKDSPSEPGSLQIGGVLNRGDLVNGVPVLNAGMVAGQVTIFAEDDVVIKDEITYANDPRDDHLNPLDPSTDALGVVSADDIWIDIPLPPVSADGNYYTHLFGAFLAAGSRHSDANADGEGNVGVVDYNTIGNRGYMITLGSRVSEQVSPFGTFNINTGLLISGYQSISTFDRRFMSQPPPYYPGPQDLQFTGWSYATAD